MNISKVAAIFANQASETFSLHPAKLIAELHLDNAQRNPGDWEPVNTLYINKTSESQRKNINQTLLLYNRRCCGSVI